MTAPATRFVDQFTGEKAGRPSAFWSALSEADGFCAELDALRELQTRVAELEDELADLRVLHMRVVAENARLRKAVRA